jgi:hypothetical protein
MKTANFISMALGVIVILSSIVSCQEKKNVVIPCLLNESGGKYGYIDRDGNKVIEPRYDFADVFSEGFARVQLNEKWNYFTRKNKFYYEVYSKCLDAVNLKGEWGFIDETGNVVILFMFYSEVSNFSEGLAAIKSTKWGYVNKNWEEVIPRQYDECADFSEGLAAVRVNGKWGYINKEGEEIIPFIYDKIIHSFSNGIANVARNNELKWIDRFGNEYLSELEVRKENRQSLASYGIASLCSQ